MKSATRFLSSWKKVLREKRTFLSSAPSVPFSLSRILLALLLVFFCSSVSSSTASLSEGASSDIGDIISRSWVIKVK